MEQDEYIFYFVDKQQENSNSLSQSRIIFSAHSKACFASNKFNYAYRSVQHVCLAWRTLL